MNQPTTFYDLLGCEPDSSEATLRSRYRRRLVELHPDKRKGDHDLFLELQHAWETLRDPVKRRAYDDTLLNKTRHVPIWITVTSADMRRDHDVFVYDCRCGSTYVVDAVDMLEEKTCGSRDLLVPCDGCSLHVKVRILTR